MEKSRTLVLNVDRDDDIGYKAFIESPVIGRDACLNAAESLALKDPEDSDVNAIFQTIKTYDELIENGEEADIAIIGGNHFRFIEGDRKIGRLLHDVITMTGSTNCILVTDGGEDEYVLPIITSRIPVSSIQRVVVSQMPNLEGTYYIIKKLISDPKISRFVLVLPGLALLLYAVSYVLDRPEIATIVIAGGIGAYLLYRGFSLDEMIQDQYKSLKSTLSRGRFSFVTSIGGIIIGVIAIIEGYSNLAKYWDGSGLFPALLIFIYGSIVWFTVAGILISSGSIIDSFLHEREIFTKVIILPFFVSAVGVFAYGGSSYILSQGGLSEFPILSNEGFTYIIQATISGLLCALIGMVLQYMVIQMMQAKKVMNDLSISESV